MKITLCQRTDCEHYKHLPRPHCYEGLCPCEGCSEEPWPNFKRKADPQGTPFTRIASVMLDRLHVAELSLSTSFIVAAQKGGSKIFVRGINFEINCNVSEVSSLGDRFNGPSVTRTFDRQAVEACALLVSLGLRPAGGLTTMLADAAKQWIDLSEDPRVFEVLGRDGKEKATDYLQTNDPRRRD